MNKIKMLVASMAVMFCGNAMAQKITAQDVNIAPNGTAAIEFSVEGTAPAALAEFELKLPEGLTIDQKNFTAGDIWNDGHAASIKTKKKTGNTYVLIMSQDGEEFTAAAGKLITLNLNAGEVAEGDYEIQMLKINLTSLAATQMNTVEEDVIKVTVSKATGINGINAAADLENAVMYNAAGQKVNKGYKGLVIVNGKKVVK